MPEMPEVQAHAERLADQFVGHTLVKFQPLKFTALKTAVPPPDAAYGEQLVAVGRRGKYLLLEFASVTFAVHLMQGGRLVPDEKMSPKPRNGQARFVFDAPPALLLTEAGTERRAGVWTIDPGGGADAPPLDRLGPDAETLDAAGLAPILASKNQRLHGFLRDQQMVAGLGRRLANEVCHTAKLSPFAMTAKLGPDAIDAVVDAIRATTDEGLAYERGRADMSSSKDRPSAVHHREGEACVACGDTIRAVEYSGYTVNYCPTCQTGGKVLADNTTSKFLK